MKPGIEKKTAACRFLVDSSPDAITEHGMGDMVACAAGNVAVLPCPGNADTIGDDVISFGFDTREARRRIG